jgi:hypothetical protein
MTSDTRRWMKWLIVAFLAATVSIIGFRAYLTPEMLFNFANSFFC